MQQQKLALVFCNILWFRAKHVGLSPVFLEILSLNGQIWLK